jgi:hypothetical protein
MIESALAVFFGAFGALILDRTLGAAVQLWGMRRVGRHLVRNLDKSFEQLRSEQKACSGGLGGLSAAERTVNDKAVEIAYRQQMKARKN